MFNARLLALTFSAGCAAAMAAPSPVAQYNFNGTLASSVAGAPALTVTDPLGKSGFVTDTVGGASQTVWSFGGLASPLTDQGGLTLDTTGLLTTNDVYSLEMVFKFTEKAGAWRRIVDVDSRTTDAGFYVSPSNVLDVYPVGGGAPFSNDVYHDVFLVDNAGKVTFYLDGSTQATLTTPLMDIDKSNDINFFLDNLVGGGLGEWSPGDIASIRLYNAALDAVPPPIEPPPPPPVAGVPEPETYAMLLLGLGVLGFAARRRTRSIEG